MLGEGLSTSISSASSTAAAATRRAAAGGGGGVGCSCCCGGGRAPCTGAVAGASCCWASLLGLPPPPLLPLWLYTFIEDRLRMKLYSSSTYDLTPPRSIARTTPRWGITLATHHQPGSRARKQPLPVCTTFGWVCLGGWRPQPPRLGPPRKCRTTTQSELTDPTTR